ncbi:alpha-tubulin N-acetyltransferase 1 isoform X2 [Melanotaenia boesemani]|uniref:alpha-tubulin N-acetyltransferase 1 isoform X2 n=1 Tax=Melanotaenia boesemani TaxID=1250792 RepID=UPI001C042578|nr:alpha-tubulin N-acetyltransferase 1 isoform X2 [Melanotaenia boesemani]
MEFPFDINQLFTERISVLDQNLVAGWKSAVRSDLQDHVATVVDELGRASAKAQQLSTPITSASKLQSQKHQLYLLKDGESSRGRGVAVGFLKVGYKKLFLLDRHGVHIEAEPLCVLDFYVSENLQRHGYGLELFKFMLQHKNVDPVLMAYDRPSPKFLSFLAKHYCLTQSVPQVNNFVVFEGFFLNRAAVQLRKTPLRKPDGEIKPYSLMEREAVRQEQRTPPWPFAPPASPQRSVSYQLSHPPSLGSSPIRLHPQATPTSSPGPNKDQIPESPLIERCRTRRSSLRGLAARSSLYSRHLGIGDVGLMDRHLAGLTAVGDQNYILGHTAKHRLASIHTTQSRSQPLWFPSSPPSSESDATSIQTSVDSRDIPVEDLHLLKETTQGWSWTVGENCSSSQWVKQKQFYRSTRPW